MQFGTALSISMVTTSMSPRSCASGFEPRVLLGMDGISRPLPASSSLPAVGCEGLFFIYSQQFDTPFPVTKFCVTVLIEPEYKSGSYQNVSAFRPIDRGKL